MNCRTALNIRLKTQKGATLVEYTLMLALICLLGVSSLTTLGEAVSTAFDGVERNLACDDAHGSTKTSVPERRDGKDGKAEYSDGGDGGQ